MRIARRYILLILCFLPYCLLWAQGMGKTSLEVNAEGSTYTVRFAIGDLSTTVAGQDHVTLRADGLYTLAPRHLDGQKIARTFWY